MVSGTAAEPPQFDDFFRAAAASLRGSGFMALGSPEAALWRRAE